MEPCGIISCFRDHPNGELLLQLAWVQMQPPDRGAKHAVEDPRIWKMES